MNISYIPGTATFECKDEDCPIGVVYYWTRDARGDLVFLSEIRIYRMAGINEL